MNLIQKTVLYPTENLIKLIKIPLRTSHKNAIYFTGGQNGNSILKNRLLSTDEYSGVVSLTFVGYSSLIFIEP